MEDLHIQDGIIIPKHELEITTSRGSGPGGQHVNKTETRVTVRWNVKNTTALTEEQKALVLNNLQLHLTNEGDLIIHDNETRSQHQNKEIALKHLIQKIREALVIPKKRLKVRMPAIIKEKRLKTKSKRSEIKKLRNKKIQYD